MNTSQAVTGITMPLVQWYRAHERTFPWRETPSPYRVWISEIMLQQTRIEAALPYFERFVSTLPTVCDLAEAPEDLLLKLWEGLGYYSRVRNLQKAAQQVMREFGGELPATVEELLTLPGIGEYTAGAIASIAFGQPAAAVDGNVLRVMARLVNDDGDVMQQATRKRLSALVNTLVPADDPGAFNQGLMELGETICLPNTMPHCECCPIREYCAVAGTERAGQLPIRTGAKPRKVEYRTVFTVLADESPRRVLLHRRAAKGLLGGMWELPNVLSDQSETFIEELFRPGIALLDKQVLPEGKHVFSHVEWRMNGYVLTVSAFEPPKDYCWVTEQQLRQDFALPAAFRLYAAELPQLLK